MGKEVILTYKGKPLVRKDKVLCYGDVKDKYVLVLTILETREEKKLNVASKVFVQLQYTDETVDKKDKVVKSTVMNSLYEALDIGEIWLERILKDK